MRTTRLRPGWIALALCLLVTAGHGQTLEDSIDCGGRWVGDLIYNSRENVVYGLSNSGDFVFAISCDSNRIVGRTDAYYPRQLAFDSTHNKAYCSFGLAEESLLVIDGRTHERIRAFALAGASHTIWDATSGRLYVSCSYENDVAVIDCATDSVLCRIPAGTDPHRLTISEDLKKLYVNNWDGEAVSIIDMETNEVIRTIPVGGVPRSGCYCGGKYYCSGMSGEAVVIDGAGDSIVARIPLPGRALSMTGNDASNLVMFGVDVYPGSDSVFVVDVQGDTAVSVLPVGRTSYGMAWSPTTDYVYCANASSDNVSVIAGDGSSVLKTIQVGDCPFVFAYASRHSRLYLGHLNSSWVYVIKDTASGIEEDINCPVRSVSTFRACPNPFGSRVTIEYLGAPDKDAEALIYSRDGSLVRRLRSVPASVGLSRFVWDGCDAQGKVAPQGVYTVMSCGVIPCRTKVVKLR